MAENYRQQQYANIQRQREEIKQVAQLQKGKANLEEHIVNLEEKLRRKTEYTVSMEKELSRAREEAEQSLQSVLSSRNWRITRPLHTIKRWLTGIMRKAGWSQR